MKARCFVIVTLILWLTVSPARAELRQWTDEKGVKHFSNQKELPGGVSAERAWEEKESNPGTEHFQQKPSPNKRPQVESEIAPQNRTNAGLESKADVLKAISIRETRLRELFERIYTKRRYVKRQGKVDIDRIRRLEGEIETLSKSSPADTGRIKQLAEERDTAKARLFNENLRTRKGVGEDIQEYKKIEAEIEALKKRL